MFPENWSLARIIRHALCEILVEHSINRKFQKLILKQQEITMSALTDLQASVTTLQTDVNAFITANSGGATDADLVALKAQVDAIDAVVNPPAPAPAPPAQS